MVVIISASSCPVEASSGILFPDSDAHASGGIPPVRKAAFFLYERG